MFRFAGWVQIHGLRWVGRFAMIVTLAVSPNGRLQPILAARRPTQYSSNMGITLFVFPLSSHILLTADWESWLTQGDADSMVTAGLNSICVPLRFWIIEDIIDQTHEPYAETILDDSNAISRKFGMQLRTRRLRQIGGCFVAYFPGWP